MAANRASIKTFLMPYIETVGEQLGTDDISEIVNLLILDHKRGVCGCRSGESAVAATVEVSSQTASPEDSLLNDLSELI